MGTNLKVMFEATVRGGGVLTFIGTTSRQAVYWFLEALDPRPGQGPWPGVGTLRRPRYRIGGVRYGDRFRYGQAVGYGQEARSYVGEGVYDRITLTDASHRATVIYLAPEEPPHIRYGTHYKFGEVVYGEESGLYDQVTAKAVLD